MPTQRVPLIVVASPTAEVADTIAARLRSDGCVVYATHSAAGCLRVATSIKPDIVLLDPALSGRLERLLRAHPSSAHAQVLHLTDASVKTVRRAVITGRTPIVAA